MDFNGQKTFELCLCIYIHTSSCINVDEVEQIGKRIKKVSYLKNFVIKKEKAINVESV